MPLYTTPVLRGRGGVQREVSLPEEGELLCGGGRGCHLKAHSGSRWRAVATEMTTMAPYSCTCRRITTKSNLQTSHRKCKAETVRQPTKRTTEASEKFNAEPSHQPSKNATTRATTIRTQDAPTTDITTTLAEASASTPKSKSKCDEL